MKQILLYLCIAGFVTTGFAQTASDQILGRWQNEQKTMVIEFFPNGEKFDARIVSINPEKQDAKTMTDKNNPDPAKRNQPLVGTVIISGLEFSSDNWRNGTLYAPKRGIYLGCEISVKNDKLYITAKKGMFSETKIWTREQ